MTKFHSRAFNALLTGAALVLLSVVAVPWPASDPAPGTRYAGVAPVVRPTPGPAGVATATLLAIDVQKRRCQEAAASGSEVLSRAGAEALALLGGSELRATLGDLLAKLEAGGRESSLRAVATGLSRLGDERGTEVLLRLSRTGRDRYLALLALGDAPGAAAGRRLAEAAWGTNDVLRGAAIRAMARRGDRGFEAALADALASPEWHLREAAVSAARDRPIPSLAEVLAALLRDEAEGVRLAAAGALARFDDPRGVAALRDALAGERAMARFEAGRLLLAAGYGDALPAFEHAFRILGGERRRAALSRLERGCPAAAAGLVAGLLDGPDAEERLLAARVLAGIGDERCLPVLSEAAESALDLVRAEALLALSRYLMARGA